MKPVTRFRVILSITVTYRQFGDDYDPALVVAARSERLRLAEHLKAYFEKRIPGFRFEVRIEVDSYGPEGD